MVQVDVFWSYAIGAGFAAAAARQLKHEARPFANKYFAYTVFFLGCFFAPSGSWLLWDYTPWQEMHVVTGRDDIPGWVVYLFGMTNVTQGVLGFWVAWLFIRRGNFYAAHMQYVIGYFLFTFVLLYGWDGTGWQRFMYDHTIHNGAPWAPGMYDWPGFLTSNVVRTLMIMGIPVVIFMGVPTVRWIREGMKYDPEVPDHMIPGEAKLVVLGLAALFIACLSTAMMGIWIVYYITKLVQSQIAGFIIGLPLSAVIAYYGLYRKNMPFHRLFMQIIVDPHSVKMNAIPKTI